MNIAIVHNLLVTYAAAPQELQILSRSPVSFYAIFSPKIPLLYYG
jgi:hypothetical protein